MGWFKGGVHYVGEIGADRVRVHGVLEPGRERRHGALGVIRHTIIVGRSWEAVACVRS